MQYRRPGAPAAGGAAWQDPDWAGLVARVAREIGDLDLARVVTRYAYLGRAGDDAAVDGLGGEALPSALVHAKHSSCGYGDPSQRQGMG